LSGFDTTELLHHRVRMVTRHAGAFSVHVKLAGKVYFNDRFPFVGKWD